jgi:hypothetical protein
MDEVPILFPKWDNGETVDIKRPRSARKWRSLSDDEMMVFLFKHYNKDLLKALQEFEILLKEKNGRV